VTGREWIETVVRELTAAGFEVKMTAGWPLVERPKDWDRGIALLKLKLSVSVTKSIYAEGMLFLPPEVADGLPSRRRG
jgi:hypothetical protein